MGEIPDRRRVDDGRYADDRRTNRDRRQGPDLLRRILPLFPALSWGCVVLAFFILSLAKPPSQSFVGIFSDQPVYSGWNLELLHYVFWFLFGAIVLGGAVLCLILCAANAEETTSTPRWFLWGWRHLCFWCGW
ncbi:MAG: hypothetical protein WCS16_04545 [Desulfuromonas sp.]